MSEVKVDTIGPRVDNGTLTIGASGDTVNIAGTAGTGFPTPTSGIAASAIDSGTIATARLGSGTASSSTFLAGDQTYKTVSGTTINSNADNRIITGSGTANTLNGETNLSFSGSQLLQGGQTSAATAGYAGTLQVNGVNDNVTIAVNSFKNNDGGGNLVIGKSRSAAAGSFAALQNNDVIGAIRWSGDDGSDYECVAASIDVRIDGTPGSNDMPGRMIFSTTADGDANPTERMRITSNGQVKINGDTGRASTLQVSDNLGGGFEALSTKTSSSGNATQIAFRNPNGTVGFINTNGSATSYLTSSDYRLKENQVAISDGITRLKTLKPYRFNFIADNDKDGNPTKTVDGFFAHEVTAVPEAISGTKDAMAVETRYMADDEETQGDTPSKKVGDAKTYSTKEIDAQSIDQSKLVPLLTSALQEAITKIETLETKVTALENA